MDSKLDNLSDVSSSSSEDIESKPLNGSVEKKKKIVRRKYFDGNEELINDSEMEKWWKRRYDLFWRFDEGILFDKESWFSVTPETIARRQADTCQCNIIIDACCGIGGNSIAFTRTCDFDVSYAIRLFRPGSIDVIFSSPPWGGPGYSNLQLPPGSASWNKKYNRINTIKDLNLEEVVIEEAFGLDHIKCLDGFMDASRLITNRIVVYLPRNSSIGQMLKLGWPIEKEKKIFSCDSQTDERDKHLPVFIEDYWLRGRRIALCSYVGDFQKILST